MEMYGKWNNKEERDIARAEGRKTSSHEKALGKKGGHKQGEREVRSKKAVFYVQGHKNFGDVYEK